MAGCQGTALPAPPVDAALPELSVPTEIADVHAFCDPPLGWIAQPLEQDSRHIRHSWHSPSGNTSYGVVYFTLPLPVGLKIVYWNFLSEMKKSQGTADLIQSDYDARLPGMRFTVDDSVHRLRFNLIVDGFQGWAVYASTSLAQPVVVEELHLAEQAREHTRMTR
jgi:membrane protein implicated in regulation of membrane protease activity